MVVIRWPRRTESGSSIPWSSWSIGLWSKVSICEGAPDWNNQITRLALAGKWVSAFPVREDRSVPRAVEPSALLKSCRRVHIRSLLGHCGAGVEHGAGHRAHRRMDRDPVRAVPGCISGAQHRPGAAGEGGEHLQLRSIQLQQKL